jgi:Flp pilus assembly pilin Flp
MVPELRKILTRLVRNEDGHEMLEYALLASFVIIPLTQIVPYLVDAVRAYYALVSFTFSLPFP